MEDVLVQLQAAQQELAPQFKAMRAVMGALRTAVTPASEEKADVLPLAQSINHLVYKRGLALELILSTKPPRTLSKGVRGVFIDADERLQKSARLL